MSRVSPTSSWERGRGGDSSRKHRFHRLFHYGFTGRRNLIIRSTSFIHLVITLTLTMFCLREGYGGDTRRMYKDQKELFQVIYTALKTGDVFRLEGRPPFFEREKGREAKQLYESRKLLRGYKATGVAYNLQSATFHRLGCLFASLLGLSSRPGYRVEDFLSFFPFSLSLFVSFERERGRESIRVASRETVRLSERIYDPTNARLI